VDVWAFLALVTSGFTACAEFGSYAFVHPVIRRLPPPAHLRVEQGLLGTFGRVMPVLLPLTGVLAAAYAVAEGSVLAWVAVAAIAVAVVSTLTVNVPINAATARWDPDDPPEGWAELRDRWERFQGLRTGALLAGFVLLCASVALDA
jgi:uncharacterized membrane protein